MKKIYMKQQVILLDKETLVDFSRNTIVHILNLFYEVLTNAMDIKKGMKELHIERWNDSTIICSIIVPLNRERSNWQLLCKWVFSLQKKVDKKV